jgi:hypothetical protein
MTWTGTNPDQEVQSLTLYTGAGSLGTIHRDYSSTNTKNSIAIYDVAGETGGLVLDFLTTEETGDEHTPNQDNTGRERYDLPDGSNCRACGSDAVGAASVDMGWTWTTLTRTAYLVMPLSPDQVITDLALDTGESFVDGWTPLTWTADSSQEEVHRSTTADFTPSLATWIAGVTSTSTTYIDNDGNSDTPPSPDLTYYYVIADDSYNPISNYLELKMPPPRPESLTAGAVTATTVQVTANCGASSTRDRLDWWYREYPNGNLVHFGLWSSNTPYRTQTYENLDEGVTYEFLVRAHSTTTGLWSGFTSVTESTGYTQAADTVELSDSITLQYTGLSSAEDSPALSDAASSELAGIISSEDSITLNDSSLLHVPTGPRYGTDNVKLLDQAGAQIDYGEGSPQIIDSSGWTAKQGLAYPPNVAPELEPWMERVRVTLEDLLTSVTGEPEIISVTAYILDTGQVYANVRANPDTVAIKYLFSTSGYPTATQVDASGVTHIITNLGATFELGPLTPYLVNGQTGYLTILGYSTVSSDNVPTGDHSLPATVAVTYEMGQGGTETDLAPVVTWTTTEDFSTDPGVGTIGLTVVDPQGGTLTVEFWSRSGGGTDWGTVTTYTGVVSGTTKTHQVSLVGDHNSYIRFEVTNAAGYKTGGVTSFDKDDIPIPVMITPNITSTGIVTANWQGDADTAEIKIKAATGGYPSGATVRLQTALPGQSGVTGTLITLNLGETAYISAYGYSSTGKESPTLSKTTIRRTSSGDIGAQPEITIGDSPPPGPQMDDLWLDTSLDPSVLKRWSGSAWVEIGILDQGDLATLDDIDENYISVLSLSAISINAGEIRAGILRNPLGGTYDVALVLSGSTAGYDRYINLNATGPSEYFIYTPDFTVDGSGNAVFSGQVESDTFTANTANFKSIELGSGGYGYSTSLNFNTYQLVSPFVYTYQAGIDMQPGLIGSGDGILYISNTGSTTYAWFVPDSAGYGVDGLAREGIITPNLEVKEKSFLGSSLPFGQDIMTWRTSSLSHEMQVRYTSTSRFAFVPMPSGAEDYDAEMFYDFTNTRWGIDGSLRVNSNSATDGYLFIGNRSGDPTTPASGCIIYSKAGQLYIKESGGTVRGPIT